MHMIVSFQLIPDNNAIYTNSPIIAFVGLDGDRRALALGEVVGVVHILEAARADDGVDVGAELFAVISASKKMRRTVRGGVPCRG